MKTVATRGGYAEKYFPNSETLMPDEMRIQKMGWCTKVRLASVRIITLL